MSRLVAVAVGNPDRNLLYHQSLVDREESMGLCCCKMMIQMLGRKKTRMSQIHRLERKKTRKTRSNRYCSQLGSHRIALRTAICHYIEKYKMIRMMVWRKKDRLMWRPCLTTWKCFSSILWL
jgi:hypothetical protein